MIDLYTWTTPNGRKVSILLEELDLPYTAHAIDITKDEQFAPAFLALSPNGKIPAIVDHDNALALFESGAIMIYLADKAGRLLPTEPSARAIVIQWLMWQMGGFGPVLGQLHFFRRYSKGISDVAEARFGKEAERLYEVLDTQLAKTAYVAGDDYSIADIALWPWASRHEWQEIDLARLPNVRRWYRDIAARPAVARGYDVPFHVNPIPQVA